MNTDDLRRARRKASRFAEYRTTATEVVDAIRLLDPAANRIDELTGLLLEWIETVESADAGVYTDMIDKTNDCLGASDSPCGRCRKTGLPLRTVQVYNHHGEELFEDDLCPECIKETTYNKG